MTRAPHVLQVVADGAPGGGTTAVLSLSRGLLEAGWDVSLATQPDSYAYHEAAKTGLRAHGVTFFGAASPLAVARQLAGVVQAAKPDLIHAHGGRGMSAFCLPPLRRLAPSLVYTVHGYHFAHKQGVRRWAGWGAECMMARRAARMIFVGNSDRQIAEASRILPASTCASLIRNGVNPADFSPGAAAPTHDLIFAARMHRQKNPAFVIEIMKALHGTGVTLLMVGGGELEAEVRTLAQRHGVQDAITFTGALPRGETISALRRARLYLFPSLWEGLPIGPIEAMMLGLPVIGSQIPGTDEVVAHERTGILISGFNPCDYAAAILRLLRDAALFKQMSDAARDHATQHFDQRKNIGDHLTLYREMMGCPG
jgi:glycosyltransferase involved in cell wall biosynthesis